MIVLLWTIFNTDVSIVVSHDMRFLLSMTSSLIVVQDAIRMVVLCKSLHLVLYTTATSITKKVVDAVVVCSKTGETFLMKVCNEYVDQVYVVSFTSDDNSTPQINHQ